jgi:hypothetical protein
MPRKQAAHKRRTTLTLPVDFLLQAENIARSRQVTLSTVISEMVSAGLRLESAQHRRERIPDDYRKAFTGFSSDVLATLAAAIHESIGAGGHR